MLGGAMLEFFPQEKITKEVKASFNLLVSGFLSLAEELLREEEELQGEDSEGRETPAIPMVIDNHS
jgi:hypothetical protein